ncbi:MAG: hypothetical protein P8M61_00055 [Crocinitomicaceae bacterium]|jgi:hypothetical protein|nr:hypothetical protein [Crocinitomicaceae bacterium]MDG1347659.1 hypothetical protein [Crocinitomicaceae bacterium]MDG2463454.1 hypothetical protein [Crocinitomicaceae bacterium]
MSSKIKQLVSDLFQKDEKKVIKTIVLLEGDGDASVIHSLCELYLENKSEKINGKLIEFLSKLNDSSAMKEMIEVIRDEKFAKVRQDLLNTMWQSKLDYSPFLADFVAIACDGSFLEAFECMTIIDNLDGPFEESQTLESQLYLKEYLETEKGKDKQRDEIVSDIAVLIKDFDRAIQE